MSLNVYYCKQTETPNDAQHRLVPSPVVNINPEIYYSNDTIVGYSYKVTVDGYAVAKESNKELLEGCLDQVEFVRNVFNVNGGNLYIRDPDGNDMIVCRGATVRSLNFQQSPNYGLNYIPYSVELDFNEIDFVGCSDNDTVSCTSSLFHLSQTSKNITSDNLVDMKEYKIKDFSDGWNFSIDNEIYKQFLDEGTEENVFQVTYNLQATGKNYYQDDKLIPAWHQARNFVQDRLYKEIKGLVSGILTIENNNKHGGASSKTANDLFDISSGDGMLGGFVPPTEGTPNIDIYNETINTSTSESDGTFSVTYTATIKRGKYPNVSANKASHTYTVSHSYENRNGEKSTTVNIEGTVQGFIRGGYIFFNSKFNLPQNGSFVVNINGSEGKYQNAREYYYTRLGNDRDLFDFLKNIASVNNAHLNVLGNGYIPPETFSLDHNYTDGTITYSASYTTQHANFWQRGYQNVSIVRTDSTPVIQEFMIPGRSEGPIIQHLGMFTPRTVKITIEGVYQKPFCMPQTDCGYFPDFILDMPVMQSMLSSSSWIVTSKNYSTSAIDGSYTASYEFMCKT